MVQNGLLAVGQTDGRTHRRY